MCKENCITDHKIFSNCITPSDIEKDGCEWYNTGNDETYVYKDGKWEKSN